MVAGWGRSSSMEHVGHIHRRHISSNALRRSDGRPPTAEPMHDTPHPHWHEPKPLRLPAATARRSAELFPEAELNQMDDTRDQPSGFQLPQVGIVT